MSIGLAVALGWTIGILTVLIVIIKWFIIPLHHMEKTLRHIEEDMGKRAEEYKKADFFLRPMKLNHRLEAIREAKARTYRASIALKQAEINALQSQIKPHFLYNTLEAIRGQAIIEGMEELADMTEALARFFRYSISLKGTVATLEEELKNIDNYFFIQQYRFSNRFRIIKDFDLEDKELFSCTLPKLTLQPIIENAIYHGLEPKVEKGTIKIRCIRTDERLIIVVADDGVGMDRERVDYINSLLQGRVALINNEEAKSQKQGGIALYNVNERIKLSYGDKYGISIYSTPGLGTEVEVVLPIIFYEEEAREKTGENNEK